MSLSYVQYVADGTTDEFDVTFPFADRTHVKVRINGAFPVLPIRWVGEARIKIAGDLPSGALVELRRETPISSRMVDFQNGSVLTEEELDTAINQVFYIQQELKDLYDDTLGGRLAVIAAGGGYVIPEGADVVEELANYVIATDAAEAVAQALTGIAQNSNALAALSVGLQAAEVSIDQAEASIATAQSSITSVNTTLQSTIATVDDRVDALRADHDNLVDLVDTLAGGDPGSGIATLIENEATARIAGDTAITSTLAIIGAKSGDGLSFIFDTSKTRVSPTETLAQRLSTLSATDSTNAAAIISEQSARVAADGTLATSITALDTRLGTAEAGILSEASARSTADSALSTSLSALTTRVSTAEATIVSNNTARVNGDSALTTSLNALTTRVGAAEASIVSNNTARVDGDAALTTSVSGLQTRMNTAEAAIIANNTARVDGDSALTSSLNTLTTRVSSAEAAIVSNNTARVDGDSALTSALNALTTRVGTAEATIVSDRTARIDGDAVLANDLALLGAKNGPATAFVLNTGTVQIGGGETLATRLSGIQSSLSSNSAAIATESSTRTTAVSALATDISTVSTTVSGLSASVTSLTTSVNGVAARYGVSLNVNGYVTGFIQNNDGSSGDFSILADKFRVVVPGVTPKQVFGVDATGVYMTGDVRIDGALLVSGTVSTGGLAANAVTSGASAFGDSAISLTTSWQTMAFCTLTMTGGAARVDFCSLINGMADASGCPVNIRLLRNGTVVRESNLTILPGEQSVYTGSFGEYEVVIKTPVTGSFPMFLVDTSGATGSVTYTIEARLGNANATYATAAHRQIAVTEFRR